jgi:hypothetical protein
MAAISACPPIQEIASDHLIHPIRFSQWKWQQLVGAMDRFTWC